jgi:hypothetical protein
MRFMAFIVCVRCGKRLTAEIAETPLPAPVTEETRGSRQFLPARMTSGTYAVGPEMNGFVLNPDDVKSTDLHPDLHRHGAATPDTEEPRLSAFAAAPPAVRSVACSTVDIGTVGLPCCVGLCR